MQTESWLCFLKNQNLSIPIDSEFELTIESLAYRSGAGVGRLDGLVVFTPYTVPGDFIRARVIKTKKKHIEAELLEVLRASPARRPAPCSYFGKCGGCQLQQVQYAEQLQQKQQFVERSIVFLKPKPAVLGIWASPTEWHYRSRIQIHASNGKIGFKRARSEEIIAIDRCLIAHEELNLKLTALKHQELETRRYELRLEGEGFQQVNPYLNRRLKEKILEILIDLDPKIVWDLYGGSANLSHSFARLKKDSKVVCVETSPRSIELGKRLYKDLSHLHFIQKTTEAFLASQPERPGAIIIDPTRQGLSEQTIEMLRQYRVPIIYVSCDPSTFFRDSQKLTGFGNHRLSWIQPIDMFPQTAHLELLSFFEVQ